MGGGSGGSDQLGYGTLPWWAEGAHRSLINKAESFAYGDRGSYVPYEDARIAGFSDAELAAQQARQDFYNAGDPSSEFASNQLGMAGGIGSQMQDYATRSWLDADRNAYMNPYIEDVLNPQLRQAREEFDSQLNRSQADAIAAGGAIGSYRLGLQDNNLRAQKAQTLADIRGRGMYDAYNDARGMFSSDRDAALAGLGAAGQMYQSTAAGASQLGLEDQQRALTRIAELERSGATQREMTQREMDLAYQDFLNERDFPMQRMQFLSSILSGVPNAQLAGQQASSPQPGLISQLASLGLGAAGISQLVNGMNG